MDTDDVFMVLFMAFVFALSGYGLYCDHVETMARIACEVRG